MTQRVGKNLRAVRWKVCWVVMFTMSACSDATQPASDESAPIISTDIAVYRSFETLELDDVTERVLPTIEDQAAANDLLQQLQVLSAAFAAHDDKLAIAALGRARALLASADLHPASRTVVARALDSAEAAINQSASSLH